MWAIAKKTKSRIAVETKDAKSIREFVSFQPAIDAPDGTFAFAHAGAMLSSATVNMINGEELTRAFATTSTCEIPIAVMTQHSDFTFEMPLTGLLALTGPTSRFETDGSSRYRLKILRCARKGFSALCTSAFRWPLSKPYPYLTHTILNQRLKLFVGFSAKNSTNSSVRNPKTLGNLFPREAAKKKLGNTENLFCCHRTLRHKDNHAA